MLGVSLLFLRENWSDIMFFVLLMVVYMIFVTLRNGVDKNVSDIDGGDKKTVKTIILETFLGDDFCASHTGNSQYLDKSCSKLSKSMCMATDCCVYAKFDGEKTGKCVAGDENGPGRLRLARAGGNERSGRDTRRHHGLYSRKSST